MKKQVFSELRVKNRYAFRKDFFFHASVFSKRATCARMGSGAFS
jgi:hypothetical protein